jgi:hypothetical protein
MPLEEFLTNNPDFNPDVTEVLWTLRWEKVIRTGLPFYNSPGLASS